MTSLSKVKEARITHKELKAYQKIALLLFVLLCMHFQLPAQQQAYELTIPVSDSIDLGPYTLIYIDSSNSLFRSEIEQRDFFPIDTSKHLRIYKYHTWLKFSLTNKADTSLTCYLNFARHYQVSLWENKEADSIVNGLIIAPHQRAYSKFFKFLPVSLPPCQSKDILVLIQDFTWKNRNLAVESFTLKKVEQEMLRNFYQSLWGLFGAISTLAITFFLFLFTILQYWHNRERVYLYYSLYLLSLALYFMLSLDMGDHYDFIFAYLGKGYFYLEPLLNHIPIIFYTLFVQAFFNTQAQYPQLHFRLSAVIKVVLLLAGLGFLCWGLNFSELSRQLFVFIRLLSFSASIWILWIMYHQLSKVPYAKYIILGSFIATLGAIITVAIVWGKHANLWLVIDTLAYIRISILAEILLFSFTLGLRAKQIERERKQAQLDLAKRELENRNIQHQLIETEIKALKAQINPHFVSNCLNSIKALIQADKPKEAINYLVRFSKLIRAVVDDSLSSAIKLSRELEINCWYLDIEALRLGQSFSYEIHIAEEQIDLSFIEVPPFLLQPFLENAIWHGLQPKKEGERLLKIIFEAHGESVKCIIDDNGVGRAYAKERRSSKHTSVGIRNVKERLALINKVRNTEINIKIVDKYHRAGESAGTRVELTFPY